MRVSAESILATAGISMLALLSSYLALYAFGWIGVGLLGLLTLFIAFRVEVERDGPVGSAQTTGLFASTFAARERMSRAERSAERAEAAAMMRASRLAKWIGAALAAVGFGGFLLVQLPR